MFQVKSLSDCVKSSKNVTQHMTTNSNLDSSKDMATSHRGGSTLLLCGDRVIKVNGVNVESSQHFHQLITQSKSSRLSILVQRDNELVSTSLLNLSSQLQFMRRVSLVNIPIGNNIIFSVANCTVPNFTRNQISEVWLQRSENFLEASRTPFFKNKIACFLNS